MARPFYLTSLFFLLFGCSVQTPVPEELILARVGSSILTVQDFIRRSEYTIRPVYCRQENYIHKKIVLNSLIAEKLTALEFDKEAQVIQKDKNRRGFLLGRREQAMRQIFFAEEFHSKTSVVDDEIRPAYELAGRTVNIEFLTLPDLEMATRIRDLVLGGVPLDSVHKNLWSGPPPSREITWFDRELAGVHQALFVNDIKKGQLLGPIKTDNNTYLIMSIKGWRDRVAITETEQIQLWDDVKERVSEHKAREVYLNWVKDLMGGKEIRLNPGVFNVYADRAADHYLKADSTKQTAMNRAIWNEPEILDKPDFITNTVPAEGFGPDSIILEYGGKTWTVNDLNKELRTHPLVFRKRKMNRKEFPAQLRFAIADLFRDKEITEHCYRAGYDDHWSVNTYVGMWHHASSSRKYAELKRSNNEQIVDQEDWLNFMNPIVDSLQGVYSDQIEINMNAFEAIELTSTDMVVTQRGVPFPVMVPSFPIITTDNRLDYGSKSN